VINVKIPMIRPTLNCRMAAAFIASKIPPKIPGAAVTAEVGVNVLLKVGAVVAVGTVGEGTIGVGAMGVVGAEILGAFDAEADRVGV